MTKEEAKREILFREVMVDSRIDKAYDVAIKALEQPEPHWIPCTPSELPKDKMLWVTHDNGLCRYVDKVFYDMTEWSEPVSDVVAYMLYEEPEPYEGK